MGRFRRHPKSWSLDCIPAGLLVGSDILMMSKAVNIVTHSKKEYVPFVQEETVKIEKQLEGEEAFPSLAQQRKAGSLQEHEGRSHSIMIAISATGTACRNLGMGLFSVLLQKS